MRTISLRTLWRGRADILLASVLMLETAILVYSRTAGAQVRVNGVVWSETTSGTQFGFLLGVYAVETFLIWRVWRGGQVAWVVLLCLLALIAGKTSAALVSSFSAYSLVLLIILLAQLALILSPAVRARRTRTLAASSR